jgi:midasin
MLMHMLDLARHDASATGGGGQDLHQLVLILADGRFHEKEALRCMVMVRHHSASIVSAYG